MVTIILEMPTYLSGPVSTNTNETKGVRVRIPDEQRLYEALLMHYERSVRPVENSTTVVDVRFHISLNQVVDLVRKRGFYCTLL